MFKAAYRFLVGSRFTLVSVCDQRRPLTLCFAIISGEGNWEEKDSHSSHLGTFDCNVHVENPDNNETEYFGVEKHGSFPRRVLTWVTIMGYVCTALLTTDYLMRLVS
jgi:hypothetical protein